MPKTIAAGVRFSKVLNRLSTELGKSGLKCLSVNLSPLDYPVPVMGAEDMKSWPCTCLLKGLCCTEYQMSLHMHQQASEGEGMNTYGMAQYPYTTSRIDSCMGHWSESPRMQHLQTLMKMKCTLLPSHSGVHPRAPRHTHKHRTGSVTFHTQVLSRVGGFKLAIAGPCICQGLQSCLD